MARMTEEEAWELEKEVTAHPPKPAGKPGGFFTERRERLEQHERMVMLDMLSAGYINATAAATHKTPTEIIGELIRREIVRIEA